MSNSNQTTFRLDDSHLDKLNTIENEYNLRSRNDAVKMLIDNFDISDSSSDSALTEMRETISRQQNDLEKIMDALGITPTKSSSTATKSGPPTANLPANSSNGNISAVTTVDNEQIPLESWNLGEISQMPLEELPKIDPMSDQHNISETKSDRIKSAAFACSYMLTELNFEESEAREMEMMLEYLFDGASESTITGYLNKLVERGILYRHPLADSLFDEQFDNVVSQTIGSLPNATYESHKETGKLPKDWEELLSSWWRSEYEDVYYLDREWYLDRLESVIVSLRSETLDAARRKETIKDGRTRRKAHACKYTFKHLLKVADSRTWLINDFEVDQSRIFCESMELTHAVSDAAKETDDPLQYDGDDGAGKEIREIAKGDIDGLGYIEERGVELEESNDNE